MPRFGTMPSSSRESRRRRSLGRAGDVGRVLQLVIWESGCVLRWCCVVMPFAVFAAALLAERGIREGVVNDWIAGGSSQRPDRFGAVPLGVPHLLVNPQPCPAGTIAGPLPEQRRGVTVRQAEAAHEPDRRHTTSPSSLPCPMTGTGMAARYLRARSSTGAVVLCSWCRSAHYNRLLVTADAADKPGRLE